MSPSLNTATRQRLWPLAFCLALGACATPKQSIFDPPPPPSLDVPVETRSPLPPTVSAPPPSPQTSLAPAAAPAAPMAAPAPTPPVANPQSAIAVAFDSWQTAWASRNVPSYLKHYAPGFKGQEKSAEQWQAKRKQIIEAAGKIELTLGMPRIELQDQDRAKLVFEQEYRSRSKQDRGIKTLLMRRIDGRWLIEQESFEATAN